MSRSKLIINIITFLALIALIYLSRNQIGDALIKVKDMTWWLLVMQLPIQLLSYGAVAHLYYGFFQNTATLGKLKLKEMYKISLELNFVNSVFPSGGVSGFSYLGLRLRPLNISFASSTLAQSMRFVLTFLSFLIILGIGLLLLAIGGQANGLVLLIGGSVFCLALVGTALFIFLIDSKKRIKEFVTWLPKAINKLVQSARYKPGKELINIAKVERVLGEIHLGYAALKQNFGALKRPFIYSLMVNLFELLTIYLVYLAAGSAVNPGAVILSYAVANFAGLIMPSPGGIGAYEFAMISVARIAGVEWDLALRVTLVYRVLNLLVFIPAGLVLYYLAINKNRVNFDIKKDTQPKDVLSDLQGLKKKKLSQRFSKRVKNNLPTKDKQL